MDKFHPDLIIRGLRLHKTQLQEQRWAVCSLLGAYFIVGCLFGQANAQTTPVAGTTVLGVEVNVVGVAATGYRASKLIGSEIYNDKDEKVGTVDDLIVAADGTVTLAVLSVGGFLGIGKKTVAVPSRLFKPGKDGKITLPGATKDELKGMPEFRYAK
jgi:sporulation protein YlmC with PRC-barrel domain